MLDGQSFRVGGAYLSFDEQLLCVCFVLHTQERGRRVVNV